MNILTPIVKRPSFWTFLGAGVAFGSVYFVQDKLDPVLLLNLVKAFLFLVGIGGLIGSGLDGYKAWKESKDA